MIWFLEQQKIWPWPWLWQKEKFERIFFLLDCWWYRDISIRMNERFDYCLFSFDQTNQCFGIICHYIFLKNGVGIEYFFFNQQKKERVRNLTTDFFFSLYNDDDHWSETNRLLSNNIDVIFFFSKICGNFYWFLIFFIVHKIIQPNCPPPSQIIDMWLTNESHKTPMHNLITRWYYPQTKGLYMCVCLRVFDWWFRNRIGFFYF